MAKLKLVSESLEENLNEKNLLGKLATGAALVGALSGNPQYTQAQEPTKTEQQTQEKEFKDFNGIIDINKDEFTNNTNISTKWFFIKMLFSPNSSYAFRLNHSANNNDFVNIFELKIMLNSVGYVAEKSKVYIKLDNNEKIELETIKDETAGVGKGSFDITGSNALGLYLRCKISDEDLEKLEKNKIVKMRIPTDTYDNEYIDIDIQLNKAEKIIKYTSAFIYNIF